MNPPVAIRDVVSLGVSCITAEFLRKYGLRLSAYPFDWLYCHPVMLIDCINDRCKKLLDRTFYRGQPSDKQCRHVVYDADLPIFAHHSPPTFFHHNPLNPKDYSHFIRSVSRLNHVLRKPGPKLFVMTYVNRSEAIDSATLSQLQALKHSLDSQTPNAYLMVINCLSGGTFAGKPSSVHSTEIHNQSLIVINLITSSVTATQFNNPEDWTLYKAQLDQFFRFHLDLPPDVSKEMDPW